MKTIEVYKKFKKFAILVDDSDFEFLNNFQWRIKKAPKTFYAITKINGTDIGMHNLLLPSPLLSLVPDHKDRNSLNNQRNNLRLSTFSENCANRNPRKGSSKYNGVSYYKTTNRWVAQIVCKGVHMHIGYFKTETEAARAYDAKASEYFGEFAKLNFSKVN